jgi:hypothetical protein
MALENFATALRRLTSEPGFGERLKGDPKAALEGLALTSAELKILKEVDPDSLSLIVDAIDKRTRTSVSGTNACVGS